MEKQTAVEWLLEELLNRDWYHLPESIKNEIIQQAKAMEEEQTIDFANSFYDNCVLQYGGLEKSAEQYFNETFNS
jgi:hypothetical protein